MQGLRLVRQEFCDMEEGAPFKSRFRGKSCVTKTDQSHHIRMSPTPKLSCFQGRGRGVNREQHIPASVGFGHQEPMKGGAQNQLLTTSQ